MLEKSTVVKGLMSKEWECSSITERSTELIPKLVGQNGISVSTMVISIKGSLCFKKCPWISVVHSFFPILSVTQSCQKATSQPRVPSAETPSARLSVLSEYDFSSARPLSLVGHLVVTLGSLRLRTTRYPSAAPQVSSSASLRRRAAWPRATLT